MGDGARSGPAIPRASRRRAAQTDPRCTDGCMGCSTRTTLASSGSRSTMDRTRSWTSGTPGISAVGHGTRRKLTRTDHSDPSGLYSYRRQPERVLFALDKLVQALSPLIGYEAIHGAAPSGWSEGRSKEDVRELEAKAAEVMEDWQDAFWDVERATERRGWAKVSGDCSFGS
jgi:hypothetical protein